jgi:hypothetical protein
LAARANSDGTGDPFFGTYLRGRGLIINLILIQYEGIDKPSCTCTSGAPSLYYDGGMGMGEIPMAAAIRLSRYLDIDY